MKIKLKNGSEIKTINENKNVRGERSKLLSFYCDFCNKYHIDYPIKDTVIIRKKNMMVCKESAEEINAEEE